MSEERVEEKKGTDTVLVVDDVYTTFEEIFGYLCDKINSKEGKDGEIH